MIVNLLGLLECDEKDLTKVVKIRGESDGLLFYIPRKNLLDFKALKISQIASLEGCYGVAN